MEIYHTLKIGMVTAFSATMLFFVAPGFADQDNTETGKRGFIQRFDQDGDGKVSMDEFTGPDQKFTRMDQDQDGYISQSETPKRPPKHRQKGKNFIRDFDKNNDGKVSQDEFPGPDEHFTKFDEDQDGYLSEDEAPKGPPPGKHRR